MDGDDRAWPTSPAHPGEILERIAALTRPYAADVAKIELICNKLTPDSILCTLTVTAKASAIASALGGIVYGTTLVCREIRSLGREFRCDNRQDGRMEAPICTRCSTDAFL
jgi:hypothetical protein